jgi:hypothetical protein
MEDEKLRRWEGRTRMNTDKVFFVRLTAERDNLL